MTFAEHKATAERLWDKARAASATLPASALSEMRREIAKDARKVTPFYAVVEAQRGHPF